MYTFFRAVKNVTTFGPSSIFIAPYYYYSSLLGR